MTLARAWSRRIYGASFAAILVPGAVLGALIAVALTGGFGRLGTIGQVISGPAIPSYATSAPGPAGQTATPVGFRTVVRRVAASAAGPAATTAGPGTARRRTVVGRSGAIVLNPAGSAQSSGSKSLLGNALP